jgi:hypothetical protein
MRALLVSRSPVVMVAESLWRRRVWREAVAVGLGAVGPLAALCSYNLRTFGEWQPYTMPPSSRAWFLNVLGLGACEFYRRWRPLAVG